MTDSRLQLRYVFTPSPNPIRASVGGADARQIDLQVMVSNPAPAATVLQSVNITIPVGQGGAAKLSDSPSLPRPEYDQNAGWKVDAAGSDVTVTFPPEGLLDSFLFTLPGIQINDTPGVVPLTVTEMAPPAPKATDKTTYALVKQEADFPVTDFYADPATLDDLDRTVTLYWKCSDQGRKDYVYSIHSDGWHPDDCLDNPRTCLSCADGEKGVVSPKLRETTAFALDVIRPDAKGSRVIYKTLHATARVTVPTISPNSYQATYCSGRIVRLHWLASNADYCTVALDGEVIVDRAPTDTYEQGHLVTDLIGQTGTHQFSVTAHAHSGRAQANHNFQLLTITPPVKVGDVGIPWRIAVTPDGRLAFVAAQALNIPVVDVERRKLVDPVAVGHPLFKDVAVTPDGKLALAVEQSTSLLYVVDVKSLKVVDSINLNDGSRGWNAPMAVAVTPDGKLALVAAEEGFVKVIEVASLKVVDTIKLLRGGEGVAVTPDGKLAFVIAGNVRITRDTDTVSVIDVASRKVVGEPITVSRMAMRVAVTPDGKLAFVATYDGGVYVIDVASRKLANTIKTDANPRDIAITPDGALAFVGSVTGTAVTVIEVASQRVVGAIEIGGVSGGLAFTPDGRHLLVGRMVNPSPNKSTGDVIII